MQTRDGPVRNHGCHRHWTLFVTLDFVCRGKRRVKQKREHLAPPTLPELYGTRMDRAGASAAGRPPGSDSPQAPALSVRCGHGLPGQLPRLVRRLS